MAAGAVKEASVRRSCGRQKTYVETGHTRVHLAFLAIRGDFICMCFEDTFRTFSSGIISVSLALLPLLILLFP